MPDARFLDAAEISSVRKTDDGYLVADVLCARTGCQSYLASEIGLFGDEVVNVYRPEGAVFAKDSLSTYAHKPVTVGHPPEQVTSDNWKKYAVGDVGGEIARDGEFVRVSIKVMDSEAIKAIEGGVREISMGYTTPISYVDGVAPDGTSYRAVQSGPIRVNHLALVERARGGSKLRVGDDANEWGAAPITPTADEGERQMPDNLRKVVVDGLSVTTTDEGAQAIAKLTKQLDEAASSHEASIKAKDAEIADLKKQVETKDGELAAVKKTLSDATSPKALNDAARKRAAVIDAGKKAGYKEEEMEEMDDAAIRRAVVSKRLGDTAKDMSDAAVEGAFAALSQSNPDPRGVGDAALGTGIRTEDADPWGFMKKKEA
jgi:hypothetical protein